jgi:NADH-quinone oxidoreductase subunit N
MKQSLADYRGLFWRRPVLTATLTVMMLSCRDSINCWFIGKFLVVMAAVTTQHWFLAAMIVVGSGIGLYYYLRVMVVMYMTPPDNLVLMLIIGDKKWVVSWCLVLLIGIVIGIYPDPMINLALKSEIYLHYISFVQQHNENPAINKKSPHSLRAFLI